MINFQFPNNVPIINFLNKKTEKTVEISKKAHQIKINRKKLEKQGVLCYSQVLFYAL